MGFFDQTPTGEITSRLTADTAEMANDLTWVFRFTIEALVRIGGIIVYMFFRSWQLALLACSAVPVTAIVNRIYAKFVLVQHWRTLPLLMLGGRMGSFSFDDALCMTFSQLFANLRLEFVFS